MCSFNSVVSRFQPAANQVNSGKPAVFDFWATWCGPCKVISPIFERFSDAEKFSSVGFYKVDVDALVEVSKEVGIRAVRDPSDRPLFL